MAGTYGFTAPEALEAGIRRLRGEQLVGMASRPIDVYSLGATVYNMITGERFLPHHGNPSEEEISHDVRNAYAPQVGRTRNCFCE